jgi:RNA binding exosome subunit
MRLIHNARLNVFCKEEDNEEIITDKLKELLPVDFEKEKLEIKRRVAQGFESKKIITLEIFFEKERHTKLFLENLNEKLSKEQKELLINQAESRLDEELDFFIRLDKQKLLNNEYWVTDSGDCFHIKMAIAAFPKKRDIALGIIREIFK